MAALPDAASAAAVLREHARTVPGRTAVIYVDDVERADGATRWTYARLDAEARRIGAWLRARYPAGTRVLLLYPTGLDVVAAYAGCLYAAMVAVPAPLPGRYRHERERVTAIAQNASASVILTDTGSGAAVTAWAGEEGLAGTRVRATDGDGTPAEETWVPDGSPGPDHRTVAMLQYTSGTTGRPKGVVLRHGHLLHNVEGQRRAFGLSERSRTGGWIPHYHDMGLLGQLLPALLLGGTCVLMRPGAFLQRPHHWLRLIDTYDIHWSAAPNFAYELCCARIGDGQVAGLDLSRWRIASNGSERVDIATMDAFAKRFAAAGLRDDALCPSYGMAEATVFVSGAPRRRPVVTTVDAAGLGLHRFTPSASGIALVSCGTPREYDVLIADPHTGEEVGPGGVGEILLRGPSLAREYWADAPASERAFLPGGFLRTGDLGALHEGELYVTGRLSEVLTVGGRHLYPQDVEQRVRARHPELAGVGAVFTVPCSGRDADPDPDPGSGSGSGPGSGSGGGALVVTHEVRGRPAEDALRRLAAAIGETVLDAFGVRPAAVGLLRRGGVRRTTSGKIQRGEMRRLFLDGALDPLHTGRGADPAAVPGPGPDPARRE
ncbi:fatty acyl-AMP ligase [Streptomyces tagetis]|uniref:Fatty acyl-AMP ligase n=1 Tax=Streptomyces tagetis TaxID=2820809 RepID=A0A941B1W3_9ACTN|nr:fatty acyl-AMP ligase [Streptomyces sp. RG38]MBQ0826572.1 fatty acyl-AMP ligase [Streptomyces sp. RG38]